MRTEGNLFSTIGLDTSPRTEADTRSTSRGVAPLLDDRALSSSNVAWLDPVATASRPAPSPPHVPTNSSAYRFEMDVEAALQTVHAGNAGSSDATQPTPSGWCGAIAANTARGARVLSAGLRYGIAGAALGALGGSAVGGMAGRVNDTFYRTPGYDGASRDPRQVAVIKRGVVGGAIVGSSIGALSGLMYGTGEAIGGTLGRRLRQAGAAIGGAELGGTVGSLVAVAGGLLVAAIATLVAAPFVDDVSDKVFPPATTYAANVLGVVFGLVGCAVGAGLLMERVR